MAIQFKRNVAVLSDIVSVQEAESLLEWLQTKNAAKVDLAACQHIHPANLQVLMAARTVVAKWPSDADFAGWIKSALQPQ